MIIRQILIALSLFCAQPAGFANHPDSFPIGRTSGDMKDSVDYYLLTSEKFIDSNPSFSSSNAVKAKELSARYNFPERLAYASQLIGQAKINVQEYYEAEKHLYTACNYYDKTSQDQTLAEIHFLLGLTQYYLGKYEVSLQNYLKAERLFEKTNKKEKQALTFQNIGLLNSRMGHYAEAQKNFKLSLNLYAQLDKTANMAEVYQNLGIVSYTQKQDSLAIAYYQKAIDCNFQTNDLNGIGINYTNIGLVWLDKKEYATAYEQFEKAYTHFSKTGSEIGRMWALNNMGAAAAHSDRPGEALRCFEKSLELAKKLNHTEGLLSNYSDLAKHAEQAGQIPKSLSYQKLYNQVNDSALRAQAQSKVKELELLYQLENKDKNILQAEVKSKQRITQLFAIISILLIVAFALIIVTSVYYQKRKAEKRLAQHKLNLDTLTEKRSVELHKLETDRRIAEESDKLKSAFLANMSHELRTPMNAIIAFSNFLREPDLNNEQKEEYLDHITTAGDSLLSLIDDIIDIAKIESQQLKLFIQPTNISKLLQDLYKIYSQIKTQKHHNHLRFKLNIADNYSYIINTDGSRLKQILSNLLENAFKYTEQGEIEIGFETSDASVTFYVSDTGIGIPKEKHELIFDRFYQLRSANERQTIKGAGLGLTISKNLVMLMGGKIWLNSEPGKGSRFMIRIPVESIKKQVNITYKEQKKEVDSIRNKYNFSHLTILIAEDEDLNYKVLDTCLSQTKANIIRAIDGKSAVEICHNQKVDIVLMDIQLPGMDGYEATQHIKSLNNRIPVIAQTSFAMKGEKERCLQAGCDDFITKPLSIELLLQKIQNHMLIKVK